MKKSRTKLIHHLLVFLCSIILLLIGLFTNLSFNNTVYTTSYKANEIFEQKEETNSLQFELKKVPNDKDWDTIIEDGSGVTESNYQSAFIDMTIINTSGKKVSDYKVRVTSLNLCYFVTGWCGTFEFHQIRDGRELVQSFELVGDNKNLPTNAYEYTVEVGNGVNIVMRNGDYFIYTPSKIEGMAPLADGQSVTPGFIVLESKKDLYNFSVTQEIDDIRFENPKKTARYDIGLNVYSRADSWARPILTGDSYIGYTGQTFDMTIENKCPYSVESYYLKIVPTSTIYLATCWNGSVEIHQGDKVEYIADLREYDYTKTNLDTIGTGADKFIKLTKNDYFIYYPHKEIEEKLGYKQTATPGFIIYQKEDSTNLFDVDINYTLHKRIILNPCFDIGVICGFILILAIIYHLLLNYRLSNLIRQKEHDEKIIVESIETFIGFIDAKDPYTNGHSHRVAQYSKLLAQAMGYNEEEVKRIYYIALLHDCGKIGIPDIVLGKPARLTDEEFQIIKKHPELGAGILKNFTSIEGVQSGVLFHHERYDGNGYPTGLSGEDIPIAARIVCVADSVDAMNSNRCYRNKLGKEQILTELKNNRGTQFDPILCDKMIELIESGKIET